MGGKCLKGRGKSRESVENLLKDHFVEISNKSFDENHKTYFDIVRDKLRKFYYDNRNSRLNVSMSLNKKDFSSLTSAKKISISATEENWKEFLLKYINKQVNKEVKWSYELRKYCYLNI